MISLDLMKSLEVRKAGDRSNCHVKDQLTLFSSFNEWWVPPMILA